MRDQWPEPRPPRKKTGPKRGRKPGKPRSPLIALPAGVRWGTEMERLSDKQKLFVLALFQVMPEKGGQFSGQAQAARLAGYGTTKSTHKSMGSIASQLAADPQVQRAIVEECRKRLKSIGPAAVHAVENLVADPKHKDHMRAVDSILTRIDPPAMLHTVDVTHRHEMALPLDEVMRSIAAMAKAAGVTLKALEPPMIDVTPEQSE